MVAFVNIVAIRVDVGEEAGAQFFYVWPEVFRQLLHPLFSIKCIFRAVNKW